MSVFKIHVCYLLVLLLIIIIIVMHYLGKMLAWRHVGRFDWEKSGTTGLMGNGLPKRQLSDPLNCTSVLPTTSFHQGLLTGILSQLIRIPGSLPWAGHFFSG